jgi:hypothetical protein
MDPLRPDDPRQVGAYRLRGRLGAGGMGEVFLGSSPGGRDVVIKLIRPELAAQPKYRRRFAREVEAAQRVGGFHTAQVVEARPEDDPPWMVTEYIPGPSLRDLVLTRGPLPVERVWALASQLSEGLGAIHACGLVHRDLKPGNVIMAPDGPRIIDFGIARMADASVLTEDGAVVGTYAYMSPEQVQARDAGPASDVFSLGGVLVFAATGHAPFEAPSLPAIVYRIGSTEPDLGGLDDRLRGLVAACLAKRPEQRPTPADLLKRLSSPAPGNVVFSAPMPGHQPAMREPSSVAGPQSTGAVMDEEPTRPRGVRRRHILSAGVGTAVAVAVPAAVFALRPDPPQASPRTPGRRRFTGPLVGHGAAVHGVSFAPDGRHVVTGSADGGIIIWDADTGEQVHKLGMPTLSPVLSPQFSADGKIMVTAGEDALLVWDFARRRKIRTLAANPSSPPVSVALSPDGRLLATDGYQGAELWNVDTGRRIRTVGDGFQVNAVAFSPNGRTLVTGSHVGISVLGLATGATARKFPDSSSNRPLTVAVSRDGTRVANGTPSQAPELWDFRTGRKIGDFQGKVWSSGPVAFSPDSRRLAAAPDPEQPSEGRVHIWLWDVATRRIVRTIQRAHNAQIHALAFSPDGKTLATASADGTARLWNLSGT